MKFRAFRHTWKLSLVRSAHFVVPAQHSVGSLPTWWVWRRRTEDSLTTSLLKTVSFRAKCILLKPSSAQHYLPRMQSRWIRRRGCIKVKFHEEYEYHIFNEHKLKGEVAHRACTCMSICTIHKSLYFSEITSAACPTEFSSYVNLYRWNFRSDVSAIVYLDYLNRENKIHVHMYTSVYIFVHDMKFPWKITKSNETSVYDVYEVIWVWSARTQHRLCTAGRRKQRISHRASPFSLCSLNIWYSNSSWNFTLIQPRRRIQRDCIRGR